MEQAQKFLAAEKRKQAKLEELEEKRKKREELLAKRAVELAWQHEVQEMANKLAAAVPGELMLKAAREGDAPEIGKLYRAAQAVDFPKFQPMFIAAERGHTETVLAIAECGGETEHVMPSGHPYLSRRPVFIAACNGHAETVVALAKLGADFNAVDQRGDSPVLIAASNKHINVVTALKELGADVDARNKAGCTSLYMATLHANLPMMKCLIEMGADTDIADKAGFTPLATSVLNYKPKAMRLLVESGAAINKPTLDRTTPLSIAVEAGFAKTVEYLILHGANATAGDKVLSWHLLNRSFLSNRFLNRTDTRQRRRLRCLATEIAWSAS
jgi:hypothetical protein